MAHHHICTNCTTPTATLYKVYSTPGSIQLTTCQNCGRDVDPYIEREWLLVIMDCVLHRPEAFRHVLYNREPFCDIYVGVKAAASDCLEDKRQKDDKNKNSSMADETVRGDGRSDSNSCRTLIRYSIMASLLRTYLWYGAQEDDRENLAPEIIISLVPSIVGEVTLVVTTILSNSFFIKHATTTTLETSEDQDSKIMSTNTSTAFFYSRLHLALTIPVFFHVATIFALIWEKSSTVCMLGTLIVLSLQCIGVAIVMEERRGREQGSSNEDDLVLRQKRYLWMRLMHAFPFVVGLVVRTLVVYAINQFIVSVLPIENALSCTGIVLLGTRSFCIS